MSRSDTWMPLYIGDYLRDTGHLSTEEHGAYMLLLMYAWTSDGALPSDRNRLRIIAKMESKNWRKSESVLLDFFTETDSGYRHKRIDRELTNANALTEQRKAAGKASAEARSRQRMANERPNESTNENPTPVEIPLSDHSEPVDDPLQRNGRPSPSHKNKEKKEGDLRSPVAEADIGNPTSPRKPPDPTIEGIAIWNRLRGPKTPEVIKPSDQRRTKFRARLKDHFGGDIERWRHFCETIAASDYLTGSKGFVATFDWVLDPKNTIKVLEGNYTNRIQTAAPVDRLACLAGLFPPDSPEADSFRNPRKPAPFTGPTLNGEYRDVSPDNRPESIPAHVLVGPENV